MTIFVDLVFAVIRGEEGHFGDENFSAEHVWILVEPCRSSVSRVGDERNARFRGDIDP